MDVFAYLITVYQHKNMSPIMTEALFLSLIYCSISSIRSVIGL